MKKIIIAAVAASVSASAVAEELPVKRVVMSTAGLAQFTHAGKVSSGTTVDLTVRLDQVDDLLKSLTIFDEQGSIGAVSLPGKAPLAELFRDLPFSPDALNSLPDLLNAMVGADVDIDGAVNASGRLLRVTEQIVTLPNNGGQTTRHRLTLMTETGMMQAVLEELSSVRFTDPEIQAQLEKALVGVAANRAKDRRKLSINLLGSSSRTAGFSYVVAAPVWKTAYRLVLPKTETEKARLQGWAVVENLTGNDWTDVELSLISGNPVALKQQLYTAFYADRPEIPVTVSQRVVPRRDDADEPVPSGRMATAEAPADEGVYSRGLAAKPAVAGYGGAADGEADVMPAQVGGAAQAAEAEEAATQISYRFPTNITLANGSTMMVPFVDREISAARTWLYQPETNARHPLASVQIKNDTNTALPAGIITAFDQGSEGRTDFVGDAQLPLTARSTSKFVTFALDAKTDIRRIDNGIKQTKLGKSIDGVLTLTTKSVRTLDYEITPPIEEDREVVIDEARGDGWKPEARGSEIELTAARFRHEVSAPKGMTTKASIRLERVDRETVRLMTLDARQIYTTLRGLENTEEALKKAVADLGAVVAAINDAERKRSLLEKETATISDDQDRIRKNLTSVGQASDIGRRYLDTLRVQEDRIDAIRKELVSLDETIAAKRKEAAEIAKRLTL
jgi:hypothetical protein